MAALILEILGRHGHQFYKVEKANVRVGRALDNDLILPDPAVSPHHFALRRDADGVYVLHSLADENGIRVGGRRRVDAITLDELPLDFEAGRTRVRVLDSTHPVAPTRIISCRDGGLCLFGHWSWALVLFALMVLVSAYDNYLSTPQTLTWQSYWRDQVVIIFSALLLSFGLLLITRIAAHRWDYPSALSFVSLLLIAAFLLDQLIPFADYYFTSALPGYLVTITWMLLLVPFALGWFLVNLHHGNTLTSILLTILLVSPAAYLELKELTTRYDLFDDFSKQAFYSEALYPVDRRIQSTISVDDFRHVVLRELVDKKNQH